MESDTNYMSRGRHVRDNSDVSDISEINKRIKMERQLRMLD